MSEPPREGPASVGQREYEHGLVESEIQAINRFPDQNPNPVLRVADDGQLTYANISSAPVLRAIGARVGRQIDPGLMARLRGAANEGGSIELRDGVPVFALLPVPVPELGFMNLYGTDVTAEKVVERFPNQNPNPVFRVDDTGKLNEVFSDLDVIVARYELEKVKTIDAYMVIGGVPERSPDHLERLQGAFDLAPRGEIDVKGKGPMTTWWLTGRR